MTNPASVTQGVTGFLPFTEEDAEGQQQRHDLVVGETLDVVVTRADDKRLVHASALQAAAAAAVTSDWADSSIGEPQPRGCCLPDLGKEASCTMSALQTVDRPMLIRMPVQVACCRGCW